MLPPFWFQQKNLTNEIIVWQSNLKIQILNFDHWLIERYCFFQVCFGELVLAKGNSIGYPYSFLKDISSNGRASITIKDNARSNNGPFFEQLIKPK